MALTQASINQLKKHLEEGQYANAEDMNTLKSLIDYEVNIRRKQKYTLTSEIAITNKQFDTAKYINNLIGGLRKIHKGKFQLVTQNITFIKALVDLIKKIETLMTYKDQTKYNDNAGCDGECRGLCSGCEASCTGSNSCTFVAAGGGGGSNICSSYTDGYCGTYKTLYKSETPYGPAYAVYYGGAYHLVDQNGKETGYTTTANSAAAYSSQHMASQWEQVSKQIGQNIIRSSNGSSASSGSSLVHGVSGANHNICSYNYSAGGWNSSFYNGGCACKNYSH